MDPNNSNNQNPNDSPSNPTPVAAPNPSVQAPPSFAPIDPLAAIPDPISSPLTPSASAWPSAEPQSPTPINPTSVAPAPLADAVLNANPWLSTPTPTPASQDTSSPSGTFDNTAADWRNPTNVPMNPDNNAFNNNAQPEPVQPAIQTAEPTSSVSQPTNIWPSSSATSPSPLDNLTNVPMQPSPTEVNHQNTQNAQQGYNPQSWSAAPMTTNQTPLSVDPLQPQTSPSIPTVDAPTDLSHLIGNTPPVAIDAQAQMADTMIIPQNNNMNSETPATAAPRSGGIPAWLIGVSVALLLLVAGGSAFFILGIGKNPPNTSLPAEVSNTEIKPTAPLPTTPQVATQSPSEATGSGSSSFGQIQGSTPVQTPQASSAAEILKARRQAQQQPQ